MEEWVKTAIALTIACAAIGIVLAHTIYRTVLAVRYSKMEKEGRRQSERLAEEYLRRAEEKDAAQFFKKMTRREEYRLANLKEYKEQLKQMKNK